MDSRLCILLLTLSVLNYVHCQDSAAFIPASQRIARQFSFWPSNFYSSTSLSRQIYDMLDIVTDVAMLTLLGIPILGLVALGASVIGPAIGGSAGRKKRSDDHIVERAKRAFFYARNLFDVLANLEEAFQKYDIKDSECQLRAVCEVHKMEASNSDSQSAEYKEFANKITDLLRTQKDLEDYEIVPLAKIIFGQYVDASTYGNESNDCAMIYSRCSHDLNYFVNKKRKKVTEEEHHEHQS